jgi:hypothetical protein
MCYESSRRKPSAVQGLSPARAPTAGEAAGEADDELAAALRRPIHRVSQGRTREFTR